MAVPHVSIANLAHKMLVEVPQCERGLRQDVCNHGCTSQRATCAAQRHTRRRAGARTLPCNTKAMLRSAPAAFPSPLSSLLVESSLSDELEPSESDPLLSDPEPDPCSCPDPSLPLTAAAAAAPAVAASSSPSAGPSCFWSSRPRSRETHTTTDHTSFTPTSASPASPTLYATAITKVPTAC